MRLTVTTPLAIIAEADDILHLRAEDETGSFGILPNHADFLTALSISVVSWCDRKGTEHYVAVRGGMLEVRGGETIAIAAPEGVASDDLTLLETEVLTAFRRQAEQERAARTDAQKLYLAAIRQIYRFLKSEREPSVPGGRGSTLHRDELEQ
ncbi:MAG: F0F1 ATP synthase subunit epsilon [Rhodomicrobium sp.]